ncbi:MAG: FTR1 family protein [Oscillatoriales cyanobacterium C42_A2020_001]|nr:FTR1 family protein [Leptolyngbyaceae cyanobacterium C42_A2020_001]
MDLTPALPTFVITLREGVEAALVVGIVLAYLKKAEQPYLNRWVWNGVVSGLVASGLVGLVFATIFQVVGSANQTYAPVMKPLLEGVFSVVAIALLSWMLIWMTQQSRLLKTQIEGAVSSTLQSGSGAGWGVFTLIFFAVLREGFETVIFIAAKFQQGATPILGAIAGIIVAIGIGVLLFQLGIKINLRVFFQVMGIFLLLIVAGLVVSTLAHIDLALSRFALIHPTTSLCVGSPAHSSCILGTLLWDTRSWLPEKQFPGIILHTLFGYEDQFYLIEAIAYGLFWLVIGRMYLRSLNGWQPHAAPATQASTVPLQGD